MNFFGQTEIDWIALKLKYVQYLNFSTVSYIDVNEVAKPLRNLVGFNLSRATSKDLFIESLREMKG